MLAGVVDQASGEVTLASAGHLPAMHMGCAALIGEYPAKAPSLGISPDSVFPNETFDLQGGCLYLYTDGLLEARMDDGERLERDGLIRVLKEYASVAINDRPRAIADAVVGRDGVLEDDLTLVIIEGKKPHGMQ